MVQNLYVKLKIFFGIFKFITMPENKKRKHSSKPATVEDSYSSLGPIYLRYTKKKVLGTNGHQWTVKPESKLYIWADWEKRKNNPFG